MEKIQFLDSERVYDVELVASEHIMSVQFADEVPSKDILVRGFDLLNEHNFEIQGCYEDFKTIYRTYEDDANHIELSNDGSVYVEPPIEVITRDIIINIHWDDCANADQIRPEKVNLVIKRNGKSENITISNEDGWQKIYADVPETEEVVIVKYDEVKGYAASITGDCSVLYHHAAIPVVDRRLNQLESSVAQNSVIVDSIASEVIPTQEDALVALAESIDDILTNIIPMLLGDELLDVEDVDIEEEIEEE